MGVRILLLMELGVGEKGMLDFPIMRPDGPSEIGVPETVMAEPH